MFVCIAHELRHEWQHVYHPDWFEGYVSGEEDMLAYRSHKTEIDAEAFARKLATEVYRGIYLFNDMNDPVIDKLIARAEEIELQEFEIEKIKS